MAADGANGTKRYDSHDNQWLTVGLEWNREQGINNKRNEQQAPFQTPKRLTLLFCLAFEGITEIGILLYGIVDKRTELFLQHNHVGVLLINIGAYVQGTEAIDTLNTHRAFVGLENDQFGQRYAPPIRACNRKRFQRCNTAPG